MPTKYKLIYFNVPARGEPIRYLLSYGKMEFEDLRIEKEDWPKYKPDMPFGKLPVLEFDGERVHQTVAICRYLGKQIKGLSGDNDWENLQIDIAVDTISDLRDECRKSYFVEGEEKEKVLKVLREEILPFYLSKLNEIVKKNNGYLANGKLSWADIFFSGISSSFERCQVGAIDKYHDLAKLRDDVMKLSGVKEYVQKHA